MLIRIVALLFAFFLCSQIMFFASSESAKAEDQSSLCRDPKPGDLEKRPPSVADLDVRRRTPLIPSDNPITLDIFDLEIPELKEPLSKDIRVFVAYKNAGSVQRLDVISFVPFVRDNEGSEKPAPNHILKLDRILAPSPLSDFTEATLFVLVCKDSTPLAYGVSEAPLSGTAIAFLVALAAAAVAYCVCAYAFTKNKGIRQRLSPLWLCRDFTGRCSLSQTQILYFSVIVLFLVIYIFLRTGLLASLSTQVLLLLGIAGLGSVAGMVGTYHTNRLDYGNLAWAVRKGWLKNNEGWQVESPKATDLITTAGEFDPYKFQMLTFSAVIGVALLFIGTAGLADFSIPTSLLGVIGLSQVTYVSGKVFGSGSMGELNEQLTKVRNLESDFIQKGGLFNKTLDEAKKGAPGEFNAFDTAVREAWVMFSQQIPQHSQNPNLAPGDGVSPKADSPNP